MEQQKEEQRERWRGLLSEHKNSGQSVATFCRERGLGAWQFYEWKKRRRPATTEPFLAVELVAAPSAGRNGTGNAGPECSARGPAPW